MLHIEQAYQFAARDQIIGDQRQAEHHPEMVARHLQRQHIGLRGQLWCFAPAVRRNAKFAIDQIPGRSRPQRVDPAVLQQIDRRIDLSREFGRTKRKAEDRFLQRKPVLVGRGDTKANLDAVAAGGEIRIPHDRHDIDQQRR